MLSALMLSSSSTVNGYYRLLKNAAACTLAPACLFFAVACPSSSCRRRLLARSSLRCSVCFSADFCCSERSVTAAVMKRFAAPTFIEVGLRVFAKSWSCLSFWTFFRYSRIRSCNQ